ncbi:MAG: hypothetical protein H6662_03530 [Ardenticatenaceae bacterium]|nr:hypothetical protein [Anaerolineales bacterium]MCB8920633.1 hypothetical protein [Ardenticatenaceae bacterium]MCB8990257.1 hypothetical protein [Ardenticatenaceae bacterium]MCB9002951.1 hypothetical protein [Ardenticatenaceae bacterium]
MVGIASALVLGFLLSTAYGAGFHLLMGGPARRIVLYVLASWLGFALGHFLGDLLNIEWLKLGVLYLFTASIGSWLALIISWWLASYEPTTSDQ